MPNKGRQSTNMHFLIEYQERVLTPYSWINQADELIQASKKLEPSIKKYWLTTSKYFDPIKGTYNPPPGFKLKKLLQSTYFILVAYAIENYFKAIMITDMITECKAIIRDEIFQTGKLPKALKEHNLMSLAKSAKFALNDIEIGLLTRVYRSSLWQGRYPVPVNAGQLNSMVIHSGKAFFTAFLAPADINNLNILIRRIKKLSLNKVSAPEK